jgi:hypothetical protein
LRQATTSRRLSELGDAKGDVGDDMATA